jgi:hypothetical protein
MTPSTRQEYPMLAEPLPDPLARYLRVCCNPNSDDLLDELPAILAREVPPETAARFKTQLAHAINHRTISPVLYKQVTKDNEYTTQEAVQERLREIWKLVYGQESVSE